MQTSVYLSVILTPAYGMFAVRVRDVEESHVAQIDKAYPFADLQDYELDA